MSSTALWMYACTGSEVVFLWIYTCMLISVIVNSPPPPSSTSFSTSHREFQDILFLAHYILGGGGGLTGRYYAKQKIIFKHIYTVKPAFKGHSGERTTCDQGMFSQNDVISSPCQRTGDEGTLYLRYRGVHVMISSIKIKYTT